MKHLLVICFLSVYYLAYPQVPKLTEDSDTTFWFNWWHSSEVIRKLNLIPINESKHKFELRFWDPVKVVRIWRENDKLNGQVIFFLQEYSHKKENKERFYHSSLSLDNRSLQRIEQLLEDFQILSIPTDNKIKGWTHGFDGITYINETKINESWSFKTYWTPRAQNNLKEARFIQYFNNEVSRMTSKAYQIFIDHQPFHSYRAGLGSVAIATKIN